MKKVYSILIALILVLGLFSSIAYAQAVDHDKIDLSNYSDEELSNLYAQVADEMIKRDLLKQHLYSKGEYIGGEDLPAGRYVVSAVDVFDSSIGPYIQWTIYEWGVDKYDESKHTWNQLGWDSVHEAGQKTTFKLEEGQKLTISNGEFEVVEFKPVKNGD